MTHLQRPDTDLDQRAHTRTRVRAGVLIAAAVAAFVGCLAADVLV
jgi:hypothetical protein